MSKKREIQNQLGFEFGVSNDRIVLALGQISSQQQGDALFGGLLRNEWLLEPAGEVADVSSGQDVIQQLGRKLAYPSMVKIAQLHDVSDDFVGFSALYQQKGWVFVNARAGEYERHYQTSVLVASLGLYQTYAEINILSERAEKLVFDAFLPEHEVGSFFHKTINKFSPALAADIADFFMMPFAVILKRALQLDIITDAQYRQFMTIKPHKPKKSKTLFVSPNGELDVAFDNSIWDF